MERQVYLSMGLTDAEFEKIVSILGREPNYTEVGLFAVMWSEHCGYKHSKAQFAKFPKKDTETEENAGLVEIDDLAIVFKVESHNHPSAVEPYHGAATGVGGILRDIFTMGARPVAVLNSLRFGNPQNEHTRYLIKEAVRGMADYGNTVRVPTVGGEIYFEDSYEANPLVNAMAVGVAKKEKLATSKAEGVGLTVLCAGAATGREGIHGATFASVELGAEGKEKPAKAQEGNPEIERRLTEACLEIIDRDLVEAIQDMGAAGFTSSACEMAAKGGVGIDLDLDNVPKKEPDLTPYEIMLSESQERMLIIIKPENLAPVKAIFDKYDLPLEVVGKTTDDGILRVKMAGEVYAEVPAKALASAPIYHPEYKRPAYLDDVKKAISVNEPTDYNEALLKLLAEPNLASKAWIYNQFDDNVRGETLVSSGGDGAVLSLEGSEKKLALSVDCNGRYCYLDPRRGSELAVAEAARNIAVTGAKPLGVTDGLNFGNPEDPESYYTFVESVEGISTACRKLGIPVVSGNVSFYNEAGGKSIYPTPIIGVVGVIEGENHVTIKPEKDNLLLLIGDGAGNSLNASQYLKTFHNKISGEIFAIDWKQEIALQQILVDLIAKGLVKAAHDISDGGLGIALAEMALAAKTGLEVTIDSEEPHVALFGEKPSRAIIAIEKAAYYAVKGEVEAAGLPVTELGLVSGDTFQVNSQEKTLINVSLDKLQQAHKNLSRIMEG